MAKLDPRLLGDSYMLAVSLGLVEIRPTSGFCHPEVAKYVEECVRKEVKELLSKKDDKDNSI